MSEFKVVYLTKNKELEEKIAIWVSEYTNTDDYVYTRTSGSTGAPKKIQLLKKSMKASAMRTNNFFNIQSSSNLHLAISTDYIGGKMMVVRAIEAGCTLTVGDSGLNFVETLSSCDLLAIVPAQFEKLYSSEIKVDLRNIIIGGGAIEWNRYRMWSEQTTVYQTYGMTETVSHIALRKLHPEYQNEYHTLKGVKINVTSENALVIKDEKTAPGEVITTNDIVDITDFKAFRWLGRTDNVINSSGLKIQAEEVEETIQKMQLLKANFFVFGEPHNVFGETPVLIIEGSPMTMRTVELLLGELKEELGKKAPRKVYFKKAFIRTETEKIKRQETYNLPE